MSFRKTSPKIVNGRDDQLGTKIAGNKTKVSTTSSTTSTKTTCASTITSSIAETSTGAKITTTSATKAAVRPSVAEIKAASKQDEFDDELESMLSLTQTLSFWDGDGDTFANSYDNTSYSGNTYDSSSTFDDRRGLGYRYNNQVASCGEGLEDTLNAFVITSRAISSALKSSSKSMNSLFLGKLKQQIEKKEKMKKREEEKSSKREAQLREEMLTARYEISNVADLWREK